MKKVNAMCFLAAISITSYHVNAETLDEENSVIETIEVTGQIPLIRLGKMVTEARLEFYELYNQFNNVDEFNVLCRRKRPLGSKLEKMVCEPAYYLEISRRMTELGQFSGSNFNPETIRHASSKKKKQADLHMVKLIEGNPALWEAYYKLLELNRSYEKRKADD